MPQEAEGIDFGDYVLLNQIGVGGMGAVYRARQKSVNRIVALKRPLPHVGADPDRVRRFRTEAEAVANLSHPNIIAIIESGEWEGEPFFSMDYVEGKALSELAQERLPPARVAHYARKIAMAMHYAHQRGLLHRDLKPDNIIVDASDEPRVADFGIACLLQDDEFADWMAGAPSYMAPEQAQPGRKKLSVATDVYAIGAIIYHLLTGRPPFSGPDKEKVLWSLYYDPPVAPTAIDPRIPRDIEAICLKAMEKVPGHRYASARELAEDLDRFEQGRPVVARPASVARRLWMWMRRNPIVAFLIFALLATVLLVIGTQVKSLGEVRKARADSEGLIGFMNEEFAADLRDVGRLDLMARTIERAEAYYSAHAALGDPGHLQRKARFLENAAMVEKDLGDLAGAEARALAAQRLYEQTHQADPGNPTWKRRQSRVLVMRQNIAKEAGLRSPAAEHATSAVACAAMAVAMNPTDPANQAQYGHALLEQASLWIKQGRAEPSETNVLQAQSLLQRAVDQDGADPEWRVWLASASYYRALIHQLRADPVRMADELADYLRRMQALAAQFPRVNRWRYELAIAHALVATALIERNESAAAQPYVAEYENLAHDLTTRDPRNKTWLSLHAKSLALRGENSRRLGQPQIALECFRRALTIQSNLVFENPDWDLWSRNALETTKALQGLLLKLGQRDEALWLAADWARQCERRVLRDPRNHGHQLRWGEALVADARIQDTNRTNQLARLSQVLQQLDRLNTEEPIDLVKARVLTALAGCFAAVKDWTNAVATTRQAVGLRRAVLRRAPALTVVRDQIQDNYLWICRYQLKLDWHDAARDTFEEWLNWASANLGVAADAEKFGPLCVQIAESADTAPRVQQARRLVQRFISERLDSADGGTHAQELRQWLDQHP